MTASALTAGEKAGRPPIFGGFLWRVVRRTNRLMLPLAGHRWNPIFSVVEHPGRKSGRWYRTPIAARRVDGGFIVTIAFGAQVDWHRNLVAARGGRIHWKGRAHTVGAPRRIDAAVGIAAFNPPQRFFLRLARVDGFIMVDDSEAAEQ